MLAKTRRFLHRLAAFAAKLGTDFIKATAKKPSPENEPMWFVSKTFKNLYFITLAALSAPVIHHSATGHLDQYVADAPEATTWEVIIGVTSLTAADYGPRGLGLAIATIILLNLGGLLMSLYHAIANRWITPVIEQHEERGRVAGLAEGRAENNAEWQAWLDRKADAESKGLPFDEPNPGERDSNRR